MREKPIPSNVLKKVNDTIQKRVKQTREHDNQNIILENKILSEYCLSPDLEPTDIAKLMNRKLDTDEYTGRKLIDTLRLIKLTNIGERTQILKKGVEMGEIVLRCLYGEMPAFDAFVKNKKAFHDHHSSLARIALMSAFQRHSQLRALPCHEGIFCLGQVYSKYCLLEIMENTKYEYTKKSDAPKSAEAFEDKLRLTEEQLHSTNEMLGELQTEFEERMRESKQEELTQFFALIHSEIYGFILDSLFSARAGLDELKKQNYTLPVEINGLSILIRRIIQFVRDAGISPILRIGDIMTVESGDIENYIYEGSPFANEKEKKRVEVASPGWTFKDRGIQFSRPQIKEVKKEHE
ncbi:MAG: hypothetical protein LBT44_01180 [Clostridiales bacterium]|jgi:hypothetical protein|nr:hypothetical protein [Clostridiales bacterium]